MVFDFKFYVLDCVTYMYVRIVESLMFRYIGQLMPSTRCIVKEHDGFDDYQQTRYFDLISV